MSAVNAKLLEEPVASFLEGGESGGEGLGRSALELNVAPQLRRLAVDGRLVCVEAAHVLVQDGGNLKIRTIYIFKLIL